MLSRLVLVLVLALTAAMLALLSVGVVFAAPSNDDTLTVTTCDSEGIELSAEEKRTFDLHNQTRSSYGLEPLCLDSALTQAAREHSQEMLDKGYFEHESYNGETTGERLKRFGYEWEVFAENIAWGTTASNSTPEYIFESWMKSSGHKANILDENLQEVGIGAHKGTSDTYSGASVYTVDFSLKDDEAAPDDSMLYLTVPQLGLYDHTVTNDNSLEALDLGAIKLPDTDFPWEKGETNTYIVCHRLGFPNTESHNQCLNLPSMRQGDEVILKDTNGNVYKYRVSEFLQVTPYDGWVKEPVRGKDVISLQTCIENLNDLWTLGPNWNDRFIVQAERYS